MAGEGIGVVERRTAGDVDIHDHVSPRLGTLVARRQRPPRPSIPPRASLGCVLEAGSAFPQLTPPICLYTQRPVLAAGIATCDSRALGYEALCAVVPTRYYRQQRAQPAVRTPVVSAVPASGENADMGNETLPGLRHSEEAEPEVEADGLGAAWSSGPSRGATLPLPTPAGSGAAARIPREPASTAVPETALAPAAVFASSWCVGGLRWVLEGWSTTHNSVLSSYRLTEQRVFGTCCKDAEVRRTTR
jgi:hypothetical protein